MNILDLLSKYRYEIKMNKTSLFAFVNDGNKVLTEAGFTVKIKSLEDLFVYEVILKGLYTKLAVDECYDKFMSANYDFLEYVNYEEKRKMFNHDIQKIIGDFNFFVDNQSNEKIYMPHLEPFINRNYFNDYQVITLKHHRIYLDEYPKTIENVIKLYGLQPYNSKLSSLQLVGQDEESYYFYHDDFKRVFQFNKESGHLSDEINLIDKYTNVYPDLKLIKEAMDKLANNEDENEVIKFLFENKFIGEKTYKKLIKKLKKVSK